MLCLVHRGDGAGKGTQDDSWFDRIEIDLSLAVFRQIWVGAGMRDESVALEARRVKTNIYFELAAEMQCWPEEAQHGSLVCDRQKTAKMPIKVIGTDQADGAPG